MQAPQLARLATAATAGVDEALAVVEGFDRGLVHGFARLDDERVAALSAVAAAFAQTQLAGNLSEAVEKVIAGSITDEQVAALAGGRAALLGAVHDALLADLDAALDRSREPEAVASTVDAADAPADGTRTASRAWLRELAIAGWRGVDHDLASGPAPVIAAALAHDGLRGLGVLLDGLMAELRAVAPVSAAPQVPQRRWADLWTRAALLSQPPVRPSAQAPANELVSGRLLPLGLAVHEHGTAVRLAVHAVLRPSSGPARLVRTGATVSKVDTIVGPAIWPLVKDFPVLLAALADHRSVDVTDMVLRPGGYLVWREEIAELGEPADPFVTARVELNGALAPRIPPLERHPVAIAEPVLVEGYQLSTVDGRAVLTLAEAEIPVEVARLPTAGPLTAEAVAGSSACLGLLTWDAGVWSLRPLAVEATVKRKKSALHTGDWALGVRDAKAAKAAAVTADAVPVLRERAGRLLRK
jgi:hypothetical protein